jgi:hypothetical protein
MRNSIQVQALAAPFLSLPRGSEKIFLATKLCFDSRQAELGWQALPSGETVKELPNV